MTDQTKDAIEQLRADGWAVAVHNDYRLAGERYTFWLLTKGNQCVKGEGRTDAEALAAIAAELTRLRKPIEAREVADAVSWLNAHSATDTFGRDFSRNEKHGKIADLLDRLARENERLRTLQHELASDVAVQVGKTVATPPPAFHQR